MIGIYLALLASILVVFGDAGKKKLSQIAPLPVVIWNMLTVANILGLCVLIYQGMPAVNWAVVGIILPFSVALLVIGEVLFLYGTKLIDFSLSQPLKALQPVLALPLAYFMLGEEPPLIAALGVFGVVIGAYMLFAPATGKAGIFAPFKAVLTEPGPRALLLCQFIGVTVGNIQKIGSDSSSPLWYCISTLLGVWSVYSIVLLRKGLNPLAIYRTHFGLVLRSALLWSFGFVLWMVSLQYSLVAYIIAIGQLQPLIAIPVGYYMFGERESLRRVWPCVLMIAGVLLIITLG